MAGKRLSTSDAVTGESRHWWSGASGFISADTATIRAATDRWGGLMGPRFGRFHQHRTRSVFGLGHACSLLPEQ
jgi:hypothetical protein